MPRSCDCSCGDEGQLTALLRGPRQLRLLGSGAPGAQGGSADLPNLAPAEGKADQRKPPAIRTPSKTIATTPLHE